MSTATATPANTTTGLIKAVEILWGTGCPNAREDRSRLGQWFQFSVHHMHPWVNSTQKLLHFESTGTSMAGPRTPRWR